jgi:hypothetical protein
MSCLRMSGLMTTTPIETSGVDHAEIALFDRLLRLHRGMRRSQMNQFKQSAARVAATGSRELCE